MLDRGGSTPAVRFHGEAVVVARHADCSRTRMIRRTGALCIVMGLLAQACSGDSASEPAGGSDAGPGALVDAESPADGSVPLDGGTDGEGGAPSNASIEAATRTAATNAACTSILPFYWEVG